MPTLAFIGAGNMAEAIARGLLRAAVYQHSEIVAADPSSERRRLFDEELGIRSAASPADVAGNADIVMIAVKPFIVADALQQIQPHLKSSALIISIAAGISSKFIENTLGGNRRVIRVMPNTPMLAGKGMSALARGAFATDHDLITAERIFSAAGRTVRVLEESMDAVTALSGSGPAYVFYMTECMSQAGMALGLTEVQACQLARETMIGAAALLEQSKDSPAELRRKVTTPNGTTQAAIESLQASNYQMVISQAIAAAARRSKELGK